MKALLLAGTHEARQLAQALVSEPNLKLLVSLERPERGTQDFGWPVLIGGWDSEEGLVDRLEREEIEAIVDASHPFATNPSQLAVKAAKRLHLPHLRLARPPWTPADNDKWTFLNDETEAATVIPAGATVFIATGRGVLEAFKRLSAARLYCRVKDDPHEPFPFGNGTYLTDPGPYTVEGEQKLFEDLGVDWIVSRNSGGSGSWPKLAAARALGIPVAMVRRPPQPDCETVATIDEVMTWIRQRL